MVNGFKMKWAVIAGVLQMIFGICMKYVNAVYFKDGLTFVFEFIPQIIFMTGMFGYMIFMIFVKWAQKWQIERRIDYNRICGAAGFPTYPDDPTPPSIITVMINMGLSQGSLGTGTNPENPMMGSKEFQESLQFWLVCAAGLMIPWMLIPKPIIEVRRAKELHALHEHQRQNSNDMNKPLN